MESLSGRKRSASSNEGREGVTVKLLRSCGMRDEFTLKSLSETTLKQVKTKISESENLGKIPASQQRIFHLGRELKTSGRSLESLGVGRMGITVLHVHAAPPKSSTAEFPTNNVRPRGKPHNNNNNQQQQQQQQQKTSTTHRPSQGSGSNPGATSEVVDLAGDEDEDNDDCVILDETATARAQQKRTRRHVR